MQTELVGRSPSPSWDREMPRAPSQCSRAGHCSWAAADTEARKGRGAHFRFLSIFVGFCWLCHCHDLQTLPFYWGIPVGIFYAQCPPQTIKPASYTKSNSLYFIITSFSSFGFCIGDKEYCLAKVQCIKLPPRIPKKQNALFFLVVSLLTNGFYF